MIDRTAVTMVIEDMRLSEYNMATIQQIITGEIAIEESIAATKRKYSHPFIRCKVLNGYQQTDL